MGENLLDRMRRIIWTRHYSYRTEKSYLGWARRYILFHSKQHPSGLGKEEIEAFLSHLAVDRHVAPELLDTQPGKSYPPHFATKHRNHPSDQTASAFPFGSAK